MNSRYKTKSPIRDNKKHSISTNEDIESTLNLVIDPRKSYETVKNGKINRKSLISSCKEAVKYANVDSKKIYLQKR